MFSVFLMVGCVNKADLYGNWAFGDKDDQGGLRIITPDYILIVPKTGGETKNDNHMSQGSLAMKHYYEAEENWNCVYVKTASWFCLRRGFFGLYLDGTPYFLGFIPTDNYSFAHRISEEEAIQILRERHVTTESIKKLYIYDTSDRAKGKGLVFIPDSSAPKIFDKLAN